MNLTKQDLTDALVPLQDDIHLVKEGLFNPDKGLYARVERNTTWRKMHQFIYGALVTAVAVAGVQFLF